MRPPSIPHRIGALAVLGLAASIAAMPPEPAERLAELERRIAALEAAGRVTELDARRAEEIRGLVLEVLADADRRAALRDDDEVAGWDDGFFIAGADGDFLLEVSGQIQYRFVHNHRENSDDDDDRAGLEPRRVKLKAKGHVVSDRINYSVLLAADRDLSGAVMLQDAYLEYEATDELDLRIGLFRPPLLREESISSKRQLTAERSLVARTFNQDRVSGVQARWEGESLRLFGSFMDASTGISGDERWQATARAELLLAGRFKDLKDYTSRPGEDLLVVLGAGVLHQDADFAAPGSGDTRTTRTTADVTAKLGGATLFAAVVHNHVVEDGAPTLDQTAVVAHAGVYVCEDLELFGRWSWGDADGIAPDLSVIEFGFNRYFHDHDLKLTADVGIGLNEIADFWDSDGAGWLEDEPGEDGQIVVRVQWQLLF